jgi:hypothetical protein
VFDVTEDGFDIDIALDAESLALLRKQVILGLLPKAVQAEADVHAPVVLGSGAFGFEGAGVAGCSFVNADLGPVAVLGSLAASSLGGQALVSRADKLVLLGIIWEILRAEERFADQFRYAVFFLFTMKGVVFDIVAQLVFFNIGVVLFAAVARIG